MQIATVYGRIIDVESKKAVKGVEVLAGLVEGHTPVARAKAKTDSQGRYEIQLEWAGEKSLPLLIEVRARGHRFCLWPWHVLPRQEVTAQRTHLKGNDRREVNLELHPGFSLLITVTDHKGRAVEGVESKVIATSSEGGYCYWPLSSTLTSDTPHTSDRKGKLIIHGFSPEMLTGERNVVSLKHPGFLEYLLQRPEDLPRRRGLAKAEVRMAQSATDLSGRVTDPEGQALEGIKVQAYYHDDSGLVPGCHSIEKSAFTDANGDYRIRAISPGTYMVLVSGDRWVSAGENQKVPKRGKALNFRLEEGVTVSGTVLDQKGSPVGKATIEALWQYGHKTVETGKDGRFALSGLHRGAKIKLKAMGHSRQVYGCQTVKARDREVLFDARECCLLAGRLVDAEGKTIRQGVTAQARNQRDFDFLGYVGAIKADGTFRMTLPPGKVFVTLSAGQKFYALLKAELMPREVRDRLKLLAEEACGLSVRVLDQDDVPIIKASVDFHTESVWNSGFRAETKEDGMAVLSKMIPPCKGHVKVVAPGYETQSKKISLPRKRAVVFRMKPV